MIILNVLFLSFLHLIEIRVIWYDGCPNLLPPCLLIVCIVLLPELRELELHSHVLEQNTHSYDHHSFDATVSYEKVVDA